jgi:hypothetical protein
VVQDTEEAVAALDKISSISRTYCREYALRRFSVERMVDDYEAIYEKVLASKTQKTLSSYPSNILPKH